MRGAPNSARASAEDPNFWGGLWLRKARWIHDHTVEDLRDGLGIGVSTIRGLESGERDLKSEAKVARICKYIASAFELPYARERIRLYEQRVADLKAEAARRDPPGDD